MQSPPPTKSAIKPTSKTHYHLNTAPFEPSLTFLTSSSPSLAICIMSDFMASAFATFLDNRRTKHHYQPAHYHPDPPFSSSPLTRDVLYPPLHPPFPKRHRSSLTFSDALPENPPPASKPIPPKMEQPNNLLPEKHSLRNSYLSSDKHQLSSILSSDKPPTMPSGTYHTTSSVPSGPMIGGVPLLNTSPPSKEAPPAIPLQVLPTSHPAVLSTSSLSVQTLSLLNETPPQKPKSNTPRPFACRHEGCSASFIKQNHLSRHIRIVHNKERPYHCTEPGCGSRFGSKSHLGDHTRAVHMRIKLFKCEMCNASWSKRFNLKKHIRVRHLGEKPFRCQQCQLSFGTRSHATRHELKVHKRSFVERLDDPKGSCT